MKHKEHFRHGGDETPQYLCRVCEETHTQSKGIGQRHLKYYKNKILPISYCDLKELKKY